MTRNPGNLEKSMWFMHWAWLANAVMTVFRANQNAHAVSKQTGTGGPGYGLTVWPEAASDQWETFECLREFVAKEVQRLWYADTHLDLTWFPYSTDAIVRMHYRIRKRSPEERNAFEREIAAALIEARQWRDHAKENRQEALRKKGRQQKGRRPRSPGRDRG